LQSFGKKIFHANLDPTKGPVRHVSDLIVTPLRKEKIAGLDSTVYECGYKDSRGVLDPTGLFWATRQIRLSRELAAACCYVTDTPAGYGLPLKMVRLDFPGHVQGGLPFDRAKMKYTKKPVLILETVLARKIASKPQDLKVPAGYEPVANEMVLASKKPGTAKDEDVTVLFDSSAKEGGKGR
jgi:hypothetical protein